jgi:hypothetical protein
LWWRFFACGRLEPADGADADVLPEPEDPLPTGVVRTVPVPVRVEARLRERVVVLRCVVDPLDGAAVPVLVLVGAVAVGVECGLCGLSTLPGGVTGFCA